MKFTAHPYQLDGARFCYTHPFSALLADPGLGKTAIILMVIHALKRAGALRAPVLILSTLRIATSVWPAEIEKWDQFRGVTYRVLHGRNKLDHSKEPADIHLLNNEGLRWAKDNRVLDKYGALIIDESSKYKNWTADRTAILKRRLTQFDRRHILTGTPVPRSMTDIFSQQYLVDQGRSLGRYITHFRNNYFIDRGYKYPDWQLRAGAEDAIYKQITPYCFRLSAEDVLSMPELTVNDIWVDIPKYWRGKAREHLLALDTPMAINAATDRLVSRRIAGGILDGKIIHRAKIDVTRETIEELQGKPVMIGYYYRDEGDMLCREFGAQLIDGRTSARDSARICRDWNAGKVPVLAMQPAAGGHGLNLQDGGLDLIWYSLTDNQDDYYQMIRRIWRQGVRAGVRVHRILAKGTVDKAMVAGLESKDGFQRGFLATIGEMCHV
jgi:SNF2 family DNA or RNA helicase